MIVGRTKFFFGMSSWWLLLSELRYALFRIFNRFTCCEMGESVTQLPLSGEIGSLARLIG